MRRISLITVLVLLLGSGAADAKKWDYETWKKNRNPNIGPRKLYDTYFPSSSRENTTDDGEVFSRKHKPVVERYKNDAMPYGHSPYDEMPGIYKESVSSMRAYEQYYKYYVTYTMNILTPAYKVVKSVKVNYGDGIKSITYRTWDMGPPVETGRALDVYLEAKKTFFVIQMPWGDEAYTKDGRFERDRKGRMVLLANALPVLGQNGLIYLPKEGEIKVASNGDIIHDGEVLDTIRVRSFSHLSPLQNLSGSVFYLPKEEREHLTMHEDYSMIQGFFENANTTKGQKGSMLFKIPHDSNSLAIKSIFLGLNKFIDANDPGR